MIIHFVRNVAPIVMTISFSLVIPFPHFALAGECLGARNEDMLEDYKKSVQEAIAYPERKQFYDDFTCWGVSGDNNLDDVLADELISALTDSRVPIAMKSASFEIAVNTAPKKLFYIVPSLMAQGKLPARSDPLITQDGTDVMLRIGVNYGGADKEIASFDYFSFLKKYRQDMFQPPANGLLLFHRTLAVIYPFDYAKARRLLDQSGLLSLSRYGEMTSFKDPRALEDIAFTYDLKAPIRALYIYQALARHLELEFKEEWLSRLDKKFCRLLRNAIYYSYGYKFNDKVLAEFFSRSKEMQSVCRNGICGQTAHEYSDDLLTEIDKRNLAKLSALEKR